MSSINLDNPWLLFLALPLIVLFTVPFAIAIRKDNINAHNIASGIIHIVMAIIIAFVAAGTSIVTSVIETDVYVLADVSYSATKNLDTIDGYISELGKNLPDNSKMGVVCFGKDYKLLSRLGERPKSVSLSDVDDSATDIVGALDFTGSLFRENVIKRIVLITDGKQTNESDPNALKRQVDALADRNIHVDAIYLDDNIKPDALEVQLSGVNYTQTACAGRTEKAEITVNCSCPENKVEGGETVPYQTEAKVTLYQGDRIIKEDTASLVRGANTVSFDLPTDEAGTFDYKVVISAAEDENTLNNELSFTQTVSDNFKTVIITSNIEDRNAITALYEAKYGANEYDESGKLVKGLKAFSYVGDREIPRTVEELCVYDEIVLYNVDSRQIQNSQMFLKSLDTVVSMLGKSLVTVGNTYVQNATTGELKGLSDMLPVVYGNSDADPKLYTLVIDTSRSMELYYKLARAKEAAISLVDSLGDDDRVALVEFNGVAQTTYQPMQISTSRDEIKQTINNLGLKQGTDIGNALVAAQGIMTGNIYSEKRAILFTDGLNLGGGDLVSIVEDMRADDIILNVMDAGRQGVSGALDQENMLKTLGSIGTDSDTSEEGNKGYVDISTDEKLATFLAEGLPTVPGGDDKEGGASRIKVKRKGDEVLSGICNNTVGNVNLMEGNSVLGCYYSKAKGNATVVLALDDTKNATATRPSVELPLYAYWSYGNGRVASYTSTVTRKSNIEENWVGGYKGNVLELLFGNIFSTNAPAEKTEYPFLLDITAEEGYANIVLTPERVNADAVTSVEITAPDGKTIKGSLAFGTNTFGYTFVTSQLGKYTVKIGYSYGGRSFTAERTVNLAYSAEYDSFALYDAAVLHKMLGGKGKVSEDGKLKIENDESEIGLYNMSLNMPLLIVCVVLYAVDIAVRKLKWEDIVSLFKRGRKVK